MNKFFFIFLLLFSSPLWAADLNYQLDDNQVSIHLGLTKSVTTISQSEKGNKAIVKLKVDEEVDVSQEFWGVPLAKITSLQKGNEVELIFEYIDSPVKPKVTVVGNGIDFKINFSKQTQKTTVSGSVYVRLLVGLLITLVFILLIYGVVKLFFKKNISSEIPGVGRGLGKVDIMPGKSLFFYELGDFIYIMGLTGDSINLIDKISDENEVNQIKAGFSRKKDFSSYLKYFTKSDINDDVDITSTIIRDKVDSLKKK